MSFPYYDKLAVRALSGFIDSPQTVFSNIPNLFHSDDEWMSLWEDDGEGGGFKMHRAAAVAITTTRF